MDFIFILMPIVFAVGVVLAIYGHKREQERRAAMGGWAQTRGLFFEADKVRGFDKQYREFDCLRKGSNRYAFNIMAGEIEGLEAKFFDYHYETRSSDSKGNRRTTHHHFSAVILLSPFPLQPLVIRPEHIFDKLTAAFGWDDIDFESAEFSRRYHVKSPDKRWAYDVIHAPVMEMLLQVKGYHFACDGRSMICHGSARRFELAEFEQAFRLASGILQGIPHHARERVAGHA